MKRSAVVCQTLAMALATTAAGALLLAGPVRADDSSPAGPTPLPEDFIRNIVYGDRESNSAAQPKAGALRQPKADQPKAGAAAQPKSEPKGGDGDHGSREKCPTGEWEAHRVRNVFHPVGYVHDHGLTFSNLIPNYPAGFPADHYTFLLNPVMGLGGGWEIEGSMMTAKRFLGLNREIFYGGAVQKRLMAEKGIWPTVSVGLRGNTGVGHATIGAYIVATKKIIGPECGPTGVYLTAGGKFERYTSPLILAAITPPGKPVPAQNARGFKPFTSLNIALSRNLFLSGEYAPKQTWEFQDMWAAKGTVLVYKGWGIEGGWRSNGYRTRAFVGLATGTVDFLHR